jgi:predicted Zn-dependent protease with MMP-like domain
MVTTEIAQLNRECNAWRETLRSYREEFGQLKNRLQEVAGRQVQRDVLLEVEHLDNQFHIQLINIHDLKHAIKTHSRQIESETAGNNGNLPDELLGYHENLFDEYQSLEHTLQELREEFGQFVHRMQ